MVALRRANKSRSATARRILAAMEAAATIADGTDPTVTAGTANANSTILTGNDIAGALIKATDAQVRPIGALLVPHSGGPYAQTKGYDANSGLVGRGGGWGIAFGTDAPSFDIGYSCSGNIRAKVDGKWTTEFVTARDFSFRYIKFAFAAAAPREIELYFPYDATITGLNVPAGYRLWATPARGPKAMIFGDSYVEEQWAAPGTTGGLVARLAEECGFPINRCGIGGMGAVKADATFGKTFLDRANAGDLAQFGPQDLIVLYNSLNDYDQTAATVQANWQAIVARVMTDNPDALIYGFAGFSTAGMTVDSAHGAAFLAGFTAAADSSRMRCDDMSGPQPLVTVSGADRNDTAGATLIAADGIHPSQPAGVNVFARRIKAGLMDFVRSVAYA